MAHKALDKFGTEFSRGDVVELVYGGDHHTTHVLDIEDDSNNEIKHVIAHVPVRVPSGGVTVHQSKTHLARKAQADEKASVAEGEKKSTQRSDDGDADDARHHPAEHQSHKTDPHSHKPSPHSHRPHLGAVGRPASSQKGK